MSLAGVDRLMLDHKYKEAEDRLAYLIEIEPDNDMFTLRKFLCNFHFNNTTQLLRSLDNDPARALEVQHWQYWDDFKSQLPDDNKEFVDRVVEYCDLCRQRDALLTKFGKDTPAPILPLQLGKNEKLIHPKFGDTGASAIVFLISLLVIGVPACLIGDWISTMYDEYYLYGSSIKIRHGSEGVTYALLISIALSLIIAFFYPRIRNRIFRKKQEIGKIQARSDGSYVKITKKEQDHEEQLTESQTLYLEIKKVEEQMQEVLKEVAKREAEI